MSYYYGKRFLVKIYGCVASWYIWITVLYCNTICVLSKKLYQVMKKLSYTLK